MVCKARLARSFEDVGRKRTHDDAVKDGVADQDSEITPARVKGDREVAVKLVAHGVL